MKWLLLSLTWNASAAELSWTAFTNRPAFYRVFHADALGGPWQAWTNTNTNRLTLQATNRQAYFRVFADDWFMAWSIPARITK